MTRFFISYRRDDSAGFAGRLEDALEAAFGTDSVFRDVDDIRPGQDFVHAIDTHLQSVQAMLVLIGPQWLRIDADGKRRIDGPDDFVRSEIAAGLASGKTVIPLLVAGASMPDSKQLPESIAGLARRQAMMLSDADWRNDVARLIDVLRPLTSDAPDAPDVVTAMPDRRKPGVTRLRALIAVATLAVIAVSGWLTVPYFATDKSGDKASVRPIVADIAGRWHARVKYDWGDEYDEVFEFKSLANRWHGTASFLTGRLTIEHATLDGEWLRFETRSQESISSSSEGPKEVVHRYIGQVTPHGIHFTLETSGGYTVHPPIEFVAQRTALAESNPPPAGEPRVP